MHDPSPTRPVDTEYWAVIIHDSNLLLLNLVLNEHTLQLILLWETVRSALWLSTSISNYFFIATSLSTDSNL